jgi:hypothetical protein
VNLPQAGVDRNDSLHCAPQTLERSPQRMSEVFVIRNQLGHYWGKSRNWLDGRDARLVARLKHHDEGVNLLFELSSKDVALRGEVLAVDIDARGEPLIEPSSHPLPDAAPDLLTDREQNPSAAGQTGAVSTTTR